MVQCLHPAKIDKGVRFFTCSGFRNRQAVQKIQQIPGEIPIVSHYDQPADGVLLHDFISFILQSLGIDRFVDEARILFQHGGKDLVLALMPFPSADPFKILQKK